MARKFAQIQPKIWSDDDFLDLNMPEQWVYLHIATHPDLSYAGAMDWRPKRIAPKAHGLTLGEVTDAAEVLRAKRYLIIDDDTEEVLVRSFIRNDGLLKQRNMGGAVDKAYDSIGSRKLMGVVVHELRRLHAENPEWKSWELLQSVLTQRAVDPWEGELSPAPGNVTLPDPPIGLAPDEPPF